MAGGSLLSRSATAMTLLGRTLGQRINTVEKDVAAGPAAGKRKRQRKDPDAPKRPMSAYFLFAQDHRPEYKEDNMQPQEITKALAERWKALSDDAKRVSSRATGSRLRPRSMFAYLNTPVPSNCFMYLYAALSVEGQALEGGLFA